MNKVRNILVIVAFTVLMAQPALARSCYTKAEAEAEQGIRIHSELMVIGLNCQGMRFRDGTNLYVKYREFTKRHEYIFADYEERLIGYFRKSGNSNPEGALNTMRTNFANKISLDSANMQPHMFCNRYANRIIKVGGMSGDSVRQWAATFYPAHPVSQPICEQ